MEYADYIADVFTYCIDEYEGKYYLNPHYRWILKNLNLEPQNITDLPQLNIDMVGQVLKLQVERLNYKYDNSKKLVDRIVDLIENSVDPAIQEQSMKVLKEYLELRKNKE